jgi:hypothetical protein
MMLFRVGSFLPHLTHLLGCLEQARPWPQETWLFPFQILDFIPSRPHHQDGHHGHLSNDRSAGLQCLARLALPHRYSHKGQASCLWRRLFHSWNPRNTRFRVCYPLCSWSPGCSPSCSTSFSGMFEIAALESPWSLGSLSARSRTKEAVVPRSTSALVLLRRATSKVASLHTTSMT